MTLPPAAIAAAIALAVIAALYVFVSRFRRQRAPPRVLLTGPCAGGKTLLLHRLSTTADDAPAATTTSLVPNQRALSLPSVETDKPTTVTLIDLPGHPRLAYFRDKYPPTAAATLFLVDSVSLAKQSYSSQAAEQLYDILFANDDADDEKTNNGRRPDTRVLIVCNFQDQMFAMRQDQVRGLLEMELDALCRTRAASVNNLSRAIKDQRKESAAPRALSGGNTGNVAAGAGAADIRQRKQHKSNSADKFSFAAAPQPVEFMEASVATGQGVEDVLRWISDAVHKR
ncbi:hypothetical protein RI367_000557 [Sorochytrium milnesiophthora]